MDNKEASAEHPDNSKEHHSQQEGAIRREVDSVDDFEHLGHDISPFKETFTSATNKEVTTDDLLGDLKSEFPRDPFGTINKGVDSVASAGYQFTDEVSSSLSSFDPLHTGDKLTMDSNLFDTSESFPDRKDADEKLDKFLQEMQYTKSKHHEAPEIKDKDFHIGDFKDVTNSFMEEERKNIDKISKKGLDILGVDSGAIGDFETATVKEDIFNKPDVKVVPDKKSHVEKYDDSKDFQDVHEIESVPIVKKEPQVTVAAPVPSQAIAPPKEKQKEPAIEHPPKPVPLAQAPSAPVAEFKKAVVPKANVTEAEVIFCKMGLDTWFNPERLDPKVESLIYWRDPKKSGPVFGGVLVILLALTYFSLISVTAYLSLLGLTGTITFRIYKNVVQAVQKTGDGHPFKECLEYDLSLPPEKVKEISEVVVAHVNAGLSELRRLFLVEDLVDSIKFGVLMWTLTYLGAWFNGMTLVILSWVALFSLPKVYEANKRQIDANLDIVRTKLAEITSKVKAAIPIGKKEEKKEQ